MWETLAITTSNLTSFAIKGGEDNFPESEGFEAWARSHIRTISVELVVMKGHLNDSIMFRFRFRILKLFVSLDSGQREIFNQIIDLPKKNKHSRT